MSVLKYNNNGTWEGLNIDHASTADSALYDADGNVISSTYATKLELPTKVSDLQNDSGFTTNTGTVTSVRVQATSPVTSSTSTEQTSSLNTTIALASAYGDTQNPYGSKTANYALLAPNGSAGVPSFRKMVYADLPTKITYSASRAASTSVSSGNSKVCGVTGIQAGVYIVSAYVHIAMTSGGNAYINLYKATNNTSAICYDNHYIKAGSSYIVTTTWATFTANSACSFYIEVTTSCTTDGATLDLVRVI